MVVETQSEGSISTVKRPTKIRLILKHPTISPGEVTNELGFAPIVSNVMGEKIVTPKGTILSSHHPTNTWSFWIVVNERKSLSDEIKRFVNELQVKAAFFRFVSETGGKTILTIDVPGNVNIGCILGFDLLSSISEMKVSLGVEVFPEQ